MTSQQCFLPKSLPQKKSNACYYYVWSFNLFVLFFAEHLPRWGWGQWRDFRRRTSSSTHNSFNNDNNNSSISNNYKRRKRKRQQHEQQPVEHAKDELEVDILFRSAGNFSRFVLSIPPINVFYIVGCRGVAQLGGYFLLIPRRSFKVKAC